MKDTGVYVGKLLRRENPQTAMSKNFTMKIKNTIGESQQVMRGSKSPNHRVQDGQRKKKKQPGPITAAHLL
jgi:hypothetical protein